MNLVRTLGPASAAGNYKSIWICIVEPNLGAIARVAIYRMVRLQGEDDLSPPARSGASAISSNLTAEDGKSSSTYTRRHLRFWSICMIFLYFSPKYNSFKIITRCVILLYVHV
ncbi:aquaporin nip3-1 [Phtheirospermum japonicum]|uniref:Aquaporin nip3-1 n=1 Tax=Phtheirospermum japonicum TaxID=374723 RepID=A0A830B2Z6_9LAMI|nr:aquaporin nip3-1 [Phtheirospermum japonicum]